MKKQKYSTNQLCILLGFLLGFIIALMLMLNISRKFKIILIISLTTSCGYLLGKKVNDLKQQLDQDYLTGLYNQRYLRKKLEKSLQSIDNLYQEVSLLLIDVDYMKNINDKYGHLEGDRMLINLANIIKTIMPEDATIVRWGGEEFVVLLDDINNQKSLHFAQQLIKTAANSSEFGNNTLSVGLVTTTSRMDKIELFDLADKALYQAKKNRNSVYNLGVVYDYQEAIYDL